MQQVNWTKQAILAGALLALGTTAYWLEFKHKPESESKEEQSKKLFNLKGVQVKGVALHDGSGRAYSIRCSDSTASLCKPGDNSKWELAAPAKLKADDANANALISALNNLTVGESIDLKEETPEKRAALLKEYGLDAQTRALPATRKVEVETPDGTKVLYLGLNHPIGDSIFGVVETVAAGRKPENKANEEKVYLVPTYFKANFDHDLTYWRDKKILTLAAHDIQQFDLKAPKVSAQGTKKDGQWTVKTAAQGELAGDIENIDSLLTSATYLTAKGFASDNKGDSKARQALSGAKPVVTLTMQAEKKGDAKEAPAPVTLTLYRKGSGGKVLATVSNLDPVYELDATSIDRFNKELKDLRLTKLITSMERFTTKKLELSGKPVGGSPLVIADKEGKWSAEGSSAELAGDKVQSLLDKLSGNRIQEFLGKIPAGESDGLTLKLFDDKGAQRRHLVFWQGSGNKLFARDLGLQRKEAFGVDPSVKDALPWTRDFFEKKAEATPPPAAGPGAPVPPPHPAHGHDDGHWHGRGGPAGAPPAPGKPLIPQPEKSAKK